MAQNRLERLRGFGANFGRALTCICSRIVLDDGKAAVLVAAAEPAGPNLAPDERVRRLFGDSDEPIAAFEPDGPLVYANTAAQTLLDGVTPALGSRHRRACRGGTAVRSRDRLGATAR